MRFFTSLQNKQTGFEQHVQAGVHYYGKSMSRWGPLYRSLAHRNLDKAAQDTPGRAQEIANFYTARHELVACTHVLQHQLKDPSCSQDAAAWTALADTYDRRVAALPAQSRKSGKYAHAATVARDRALLLARPAPTPPPRLGIATQPMGIGETATDRCRSSR